MTSRQQPVPHICLSVRQPWAWMIFNAGKDIENRSWTTNVRGTVLIHASKGVMVYEWLDAWAFVRTGIRSGVLSVDLIATSNALARNNIDRGGIVGAVDIVDCVAESSSPWFMGTYGFKLANPRPIPLIPCRGQLGFFKLPAELTARVEEALHAR